MRLLGDHCSRRVVGAGAALLVLALLGSSGAQASGIALGRFGGIYGHSNADGGLALWWNPGRLSVEPGFFVSLDGTLVYRLSTFDRVVDDTATEDEILVNSGEASLSTAAVLPYAAVGYTFELDRVNLGLAFGIIPPWGGQAAWDKQFDAPSQFPGAVDGPQRWSAIESSLVVLHYTGGLSFSFPDIGLSVGLGAAFVSADLETVRARNLNRTDDLVDADGNLLEGRAHFSGEDRAAAFHIGASYERGPVLASFTYRAKYDLRLVGPVRQAYATSEPTTADAFLELPIPHVFQTAITVRIDKLVVTGITDFTAWSIFDENDVLQAETRERLLLIPRDFENVFSARAMVGWNFTEALGIDGSIGYDPSAVPPETLDASIVDSAKLLLGLGLRYRTDHWRLLTSYQHEIFFAVESTNNRHEPAQNGDFSETRGLLNVSLEARF